MIVQKEAEIQQLLQKLEEQQALQHQTSSRLQDVMQREAAVLLIEELKTQLSEEEQARNIAEEKLAVAQLHTDKLQKRMEEFKRLELTAQSMVRLCL